MVSHQFVQRTVPILPPPSVTTVEVSFVAATAPVSWIASESVTLPSCPRFIAHCTLLI
jgi:hypothetical protein